MYPSNCQPLVIVLDDDDAKQEAPSNDAALKQKLSDDINRYQHFQGKQKNKATSYDFKQKQIDNIMKPQVSQMKHVNQSKAKAVAVIPDNHQNDKLRFRVMKPSELEELAAQDPVFMSNIEHKTKHSFLEMFYEFTDSTMGSLFSALIPTCTPSQKQYQLSDEVPPPWWPTMKAKWWVEFGFPTDKGEPPFQSPQSLTKLWKLAVLASIIDFYSPKRVCRIVKQSKHLQKKMSLKEKFILSIVLHLFVRDKVKWMETDKKMISVPAKCGRIETFLPLAVAKEEMDDKFGDNPSNFPSTNTVQLNPRVVSSSSGPLHAASNGQQERKIVSNGFNMESRKNWGVDHWNKRNSKTATNNMLRLTRMRGRNGIVLALPTFEKKRTLSLPHENAAREEKTTDESSDQRSATVSAQPAVVSSPQSLIDVTSNQTQGSQMIAGPQMEVNPNPVSLSADPVYEHNQVANTTVDQDIKALVNREIVMNKKNMGIPQKLDVTDNETTQFSVNVTRSQAIEGPQVNQDQPSFSAVNYRQNPSLMSSTTGPVHQYNQVDTDIGNKDMQTLLSGDSIASNMNWESSQGSPTVSRPAGPQMNPGQPLFSAVNHSMKVTPNLMNLSTGPRYEYKTTTIGNPDLTTVVNESGAINVNRGVSQISLALRGRKGLQMSGGQPSFSPVNNSLQVNLNLNSSNAGHVYEYNQLAATIGNQDLMTVVNENGALHMNRGVSQRYMATSGHEGLQMSRDLSSFSPVNNGLQVNPNLKSSSAGPDHEHYELAATIEDLLKVMNGNDALNVDRGVSQEYMATSGLEVIAGPQMSGRQPSFSPVNNSLQVNTNLNSSSAGPVGSEYNQLATRIGDQDLQTVVNFDSVACNMNWGGSQRSPTASAFGGLQMSRGQPSFSPVNNSLQVNRNLKSSRAGPAYEYSQLVTPSGNQDLQTVVNVDNVTNNMNWGVSQGSLRASGSAGIMNHLNFPQKINTATNAVPVSRMIAGLQMNRGQSVFSPSNYSPQVNPTMSSSAAPVYEYNQVPTTINNQEMQALLNGHNNTVQHMNWGLKGILTAPVQPAVTTNSLQRQENLMNQNAVQKESVKEPDQSFLPLMDMKLVDFAEFEDYFTGFDVENTGEKVKGQVLHPSSSSTEVIPNQRDIPINEFDGYQIDDWTDYLDNLWHLLQ